MNYWIMKTDADAYSWSELAIEGRTTWDGVKNPLALIHMRAMAEGDRVMIYHSGGEKSLMGVARITKPPMPDPNRNDPKLVVVEVKAEKPLPNPVPLATLKADPAFASLGLVRMPRLSVMPVERAQWERLLELGGLPARKST